MNPQEFELLEMALYNPLNPELSGFAAEAALKKLGENWRCAFRDGSKPDIVITDITRTIKDLQKVKEAAKKHLGSEQQETQEEPEGLYITIPGCEASSTGTVIRKDLVEALSAYPNYEFCAFVPQHPISHQNNLSFSILLRRKNNALRMDKTTTRRLETLLEKARKEGDTPAILALEDTLLAINNTQKA